jgi:comEA protein
MADKKSNTLAEKLILFAVFIVFAGIIVAFAFSWNYVGEDDFSGGTVSLQYHTQSKSQTVNDQSTEPSKPSGVVGDKININFATVDELDTLDGIGPSKAEAIVKYRETQGPFLKIEDIMNVSGIGEKTFEKLKDYITVG